MTTPAAEGFTMPGEWERHTRCWMAWPCRPETWPEGAFDAAAAAYTDVARAISRFEPVTMVCDPADVADASLACGPGVEILPLPISDSWIRDTGPSFVTDGKGQLAGVHWRFNAWGGNYPDSAKDQEVGRLMLDHLGLRRFEAPLVMEGGSFHVDGEGTLLTTEQCLLNPNRNPNLGKAEIEELLKEHLGISSVIWLGEGYQDDETDGHIDEIALFVKPGVVMAITTDDPGDANFKAFQDNLDRLKRARDAQGRELEVIPVRQPARRDENGVRLTLSYTNLYIANGGIVMPAFEDSADDEAFRIVRRAFPDREVVQVPALDIVRGGGGIHCITQQQPAV
ncbi:agmatine deiminase [Azospirillum argentinense]|uniref:Putative agmatine deiminase n=1 Tax=Azospirillum argentinense TaxID=2970906 RepID=A0A5B0L586_9PROT|nr:agmatine deiminase family protein [Azospirillum argentinense]AIB11708.1 agmatine deiminase [Azospirillum argentinense]EZQ08614.1 agmatine deiminase [Azospirillum argentinense]KAA1059043.1 Agmatine deiminase [Azospirillum argentinense]MBK3799048.1 agmatine deiminase [Azospirillum argentinense]PNR00895.1 agmatine deiminase family protein [Azospirillum argentinense]